MVLAKIGVVIQVGFEDKSAIGIMRGNPWSAKPSSIDLMACIIGNPTSARLLASEGAVEVADPDDVHDCALKVQAVVRNASMKGTDFDIDVGGSPVVFRHCWSGGGWLDCGFGYSFEIKQKAGSKLVEFGPDSGFLNGIKLRTRYLGYIQEA